MFNVFRKPDPIADRENYLLWHEHAEFLRLVQRQLFFNSILSNNYNCLLSPQYLPLFATFKTFFFCPATIGSLSNSVKLDDLTGLISDGITLLRLSQIQLL